MAHREDVGRVIDALTNNLFQAAGVSRAHFQKYRANFPPEYHHYVAPFMANDEVRQVKTNLSKVVCDGFDPNIRIEPFPREYLESVLVLEAPRKVVQFNAGASESKAKAAPRVVKQAKTRVKVVNVGAAASTNLEDDEEEVIPRPVPPRPAPAPAPAPVVVKRARITPAGLPSNFYPIVLALFEEFWTKEFSDLGVRYALFANITHANCSEYGLTGFSEKPSSLTVINEKLQQRRYLSKEEFKHDFDLLFTNIYRFFPSAHPAIAVAKDLELLFESRWSVLEPQFRW